MTEMDRGEGGARNSHPRLSNVLGGAGGASVLLITDVEEGCSRTRFSLLLAQTRRVEGITMEAMEAEDDL